MRWSVSWGLLAVLLAVGGPALPADLENLPPEVRRQTSPVRVNWGKLLEETLKGALGLQGIQLPGTVGVGQTPGPVTLAGLQGPQLPGAGGKQVAAEGAAQLPATLGIPAAGPVGSSALSEAIQSALVGLLVNGGLSADEWKEHLTAAKCGVSDVSVIWRRLQREHPQEAERVGVTGAYWQAVEALTPVEARDPTKLALDEAFALGEIQLWGNDLGDAQATFAALLARLPDGPTTGRVSRGLLAYRTAQCCEYRSDLEQAREWYLKCAEWGTPEMTGGYDVRGEGLVEAARMCRRLGQADRAGEFYRAALALPGWGRTVAALDLSELLRTDGEYGQAREVLENLLAHPAAPTENVLVAAQLGAVYYDAGDAEAARRAFDASSAALAQIADQRQREMARSALGTVETLRRRLDDWERDPFRTSAPRIVLTRARGESERPSRFFVETWRPVPLSITSSLPMVVLRALGEPRRVQGAARTDFEVALDQEAPVGSISGKVTITSEALPGAALTVPVRVTVVGQIECVPIAVFFGPIRPGEAQARTITVRSRSGAAFTLRSAQTNGGPALIIGPPVRQGDGEWTVPVTLQATEPFRLQSSITLVTDVAGEERMEIPVYAGAQVAQ